MTIGAIFAAIHLLLLVSLYITAIVKDCWNMAIIFAIQILLVVMEGVMV